MTKTSMQVYDSLRSKYEISPSATPTMGVVNKVSKWQCCKYNPGIKPGDSVGEWRQHLMETQHVYPIDEPVRCRHAFYVLLHAVRDSPACESWINIVEWADFWGSVWNFDNLYEQFITAEHWGVAGHVNTS
ncbi:hypothetical protein N7457_006337 [Penicillium paradoxum]|uniref:uncharacterized protein n=1 Tax=Penicillium paradoxum TaxID=176176 RepID=UPI002549A23A|nr:uncharacterized protein N7457_006337 [Penicillium paradoxum]KAJ5781177.1 hypothetical protein N7457_006337 [Penicillium paradoxum]